MRRCGANVHGLAASVGGVLDRLRYPIIQAPMAGGASTVAMAAAVSRAGGLGFLATGMLSPDRVAAELAELRALLAGGEPFGVNLFCPSAAPGDTDEIAAYAELIAPLARDAGVELGEPRFHDDRYPEKVELLLADPPPVVSFVFGCPVDDIRRFQEAGAQVWVTVAQIDEARQAVAAGAGALILQGGEAGGHRGGIVDDDRPPVPLLELLDAVGGALPGVPLIAAGALMTADHVAQVLDRGAAAAQCGTAFLLAPESGIAELHRAAIRSAGQTVITRAFTGRRARGLANGWTELAADRAPRAYPQVMELTAPIRSAARIAGDAERLNLWAGERHAQAEALPAEQIVRRLAGES